MDWNGASLRCLTFELSRPRRQPPAGRGRTIFSMARSGQTVAAVAGRRLERGVRRRSAALHQGWVSAYTKGVLRLAARTGSVASLVLRT